MKNETDTQAILQTFIMKIKIDYMDDLQEHIIEINHRIPIYEDGMFTAILSSDGIDMNDGINVIDNNDFRTAPELQKKRTA